jgi:hypothetical protein
MDLNSLINITSGKTQLAVATQVLKKTQEIEGAAIKQLIDSMPRPSPSAQGVGQNLDLFA